MCKCYVVSQWYCCADLGLEGFERGYDTNDLLRKPGEHTIFRQYISIETRDLLG